MVPRIPLVITCLLLAMTAGAAWGKGPAGDHSETISPVSNIEGWDDDSEDARISSWTWFGMGYEFRNSGNGSTTAIASGITPQRVNNGKK